VAISLIPHQSIATFLLSLLISTAPALQHLGETYIAHRESAAEKDELAHRIEDLWDIALREPGSVTRDQCRQIQDRIFSLRKDGPLVPDRWYKWLQKNYQTDMDKTAEELRAQAEKTL
jgi:SMODS-associating 4TM effector domain